MKYFYSFCLVFLMPMLLLAQQNKHHQFADLTAGFGQSQATASLSVWNHWYTGKNRKLELGIGARASSYFGTKKDFITAPAGISRGSSVPFLVVVSSQKTENWDTLTVQQPRVISVNAALSARYNFTPKISAGLNIDLIGFTLGRKSSAVFPANGNAQTITARPTRINALLTGDLDYGSLNSEFYVSYALNQQFSLRAVYQFYFAEYTTPQKIQQLPEPNDRFRNKANLLGLGVSYHFKK
jgi:hypothetical protein